MKTLTIKSLRAAARLWRYHVSWWIYGRHISEIKYGKGKFLGWLDRRIRARFVGKCCKCGAVKRWDGGCPANKEDDWLKR